jgi:hypothetical protein
MVAMLLPGLCAMTALALDLGLLAVSRTACQSAADAAALVGTRSLDNKPTSVNSNQVTAAAAANSVVGLNNLAANAAAPNATTVQFGFYKYYDSTTTPAYTPAQFSVEQWYPAGSALPGTERSWTATKVTVTANQVSLFSNVMGVANLKSYAEAVAVFRPRDIAMTLDMTGSMKFGCMVSANGAYMSCDPLYPQAGHYSRYPAYAANNPNTGSGAATASARHNPFFTSKSFDSSGESWAPNNFTAANAGGPAAVKDFYYDPGNVASPTTTLVTPSVPSLKPAFHHWDPSVTNPGDPDNYIAATYDYSGWSGATTPTTAGTYSLYPAPEMFKDQTDPQFIGDRYPRKRGAERLASPGSWDPTAANGATYTLAEYLGWTNRYTSGNPSFSTPGFGPPGTPQGRNDGPVLTTNASIGRNSLVPPAPLYGTAATILPVVNDWRNFRDATWEKYGYDLNVQNYVNHPIAPRPANWDPGVDSEQPAPTLPTQPRGYPDGDPRRTWWATYKNHPTAPLVTPGRFQGYTMGPGYWGKSFFMWPPDPRPAQDWRRKFFFNFNATANAADGSFPLQVTINNDPTLGSADNGAAGGPAENINQVILRSGVNETLNINTNNLQINYRAVLAWVKQPPLALPPNLRAGRVVYYTSIPDDVDTASGSADAQRDKAFWKGYIDYVFRSANVTAFESRGWPEGATPAIFQSTTTAFMNGYDIDGAGLTPADPVPYMNYLDNPSRPRSNFWFGPITMMSMLNNEGAWAGTVHETQTWQLKAGVNSVLDDIRNNHPNDNVGLSYFCTNRYGYFSVGCSQDFDLLKASMFYPKTLVESGDVWNNPSKEQRAFDTNPALNWQLGGQVQNAQSGTDPNTGMATCFNILAPTATATPTRPTLPPAPYGTASASRRGRRGAAKIVIFETDGVPNAASTANYQTLGFNSYYDINVGATSSYGNAGWATAATPALAIIDQMVKPLASTTSGDSGLSSPSSPTKVYAIGFGDLFNVVPQPPTAVNARTFLLQVQQRGGTSAATDAAIPAYQIITGPYQTRIDSLKTAFERILQSGVQVTLIQ